ncbi:Mitochondrial inner membrane i-AAA protease supercomplex subunit YME1 [Exophiala dermatitidis]|uniref:Intermembrane space AAA protease IAP-1 n=1 Tax=Exophiala dermatitidis (strain ATCC 34100 / CBS 525.76 / NIH/UT8656) TaxID=858893 RepID=H6CAN7_EXODN|nr:intermembrane space AAA protease IAP-1 [Exophiala dermatitidis NIH/UT8656]EHY60834.1 intermembrane space AAA protease IAP-1 [Exophiala dermatitidis NIH/UT8656]
MALQAPLSQLPSLSILGPDLRTALPSLVTSPLKTLRRNRVARLKAEPEAQPTQHKQTTTERSINNPSASPAMRLPDVLANVPIESLRSAPLHVRQHQTLPWLSGTLRTTMATNSFILPTSRSYTTRAPPLPTLRVAARTDRVKAPRFQSPMPSMSSILFGRPGTGHTTGLKNHYRQFSNTFQPQNQNMLAHMERTANNNPTSATAQNAFYSALLRANMPKLVIERYQSGRYASNAATDATYLKALQLVGSVPAPGTPNHAASSPQGGALPPETLQAVGQAVAGQNYGGSLVMPSNKSGTGAREAPLYVVVEESWGNTILKWVKTFLWVGLAGYFLLVILTMVVEMSGSLRTRVGQNNEVQPQHQTVRFSDVHGCDEAKEELQELVEFLKNPEKFNKLGGKLPKGVLLVGPPGTGKTMLARAVAGEAGVPVFYMSGSEFDELYVGVGAKRVRDLFAQARNKAPAIIFIDELDAVGGKRNARDPAYAKQTLNQLLTELDGFSPSTGVILIAATNYPESLDKALTRPGRFDRHINVPLPDVRGRIEILKHHMRNMPVAADVDATVLARATSGMSGADLENLCNQAAVHASRLKYKKVNAQNFEWAKDKIMMGAEVKSRMIREKDKIQTAYHEAGHALVNLFTPGSSQLYKMTIIPRGRALGVTHFLPEMDAVSMGYDQFLAQIDVAMGGRAAEELIFGPNKVTSGIAHDVQSATRTAYHLVTQCGYSSKLGNVDLASDYNNLSSETKMEIEREVRDIVEAGRQRADRIVKEKRKELEALKDALLEFETLDREEINKILRGEKLKRLEVQVRESDDDGGSSTQNKTPQPKKDKDIGPKGVVGIKIPDVFIPPGAGTRGENENARASER